MQTSISAVILTWNDSKLTSNCVASLVGQVAPSNIIIVDNGSASSVRTELKNLSARYGITLQRNEENLGYADGMNSGLRLVTTPNTLLSNNDVEYSENAIDQLVRALQDPMIRLAQPEIRDRSGNPVKEGGRFPTFARVAGRAVFLDVLIPWFRLTTAKPRSMDWFGGPAIAVRTQNLRDVGGLRSSVGFYGEDLNLSWDLRHAGGRAVTLHSCHAIHADEATAAKRWSERERAQMKAQVWAYAARDCAPNRLGLIALALFRLRHLFVRTVRSSKPGEQVSKCVS